MKYKCKNIGCTFEMDGFCTSVGCDGSEDYIKSKRIAELDAGLQNEQALNRQNLETIEKLKSELEKAK